MATKFGTITAITQLIENIAEMLILEGGFMGQAVQWCQTISTTANCCCHGSEI